MTTNELDVTGLDSADGDLGGLTDAIDLASDQDTTTWLVSDGKRIAAIVPVDVAEHDQVRHG